MASGITLLGLGPGNPEQLTRQAWRVLEAASEVYLRTQQHPVMEALKASFPRLEVHSFDSIYDSQATFEQVYASIVEQVLELGRRPQGVIYAMPGDPFVAEATGVEISRRARLENLPVEVVPGLSFLEPVFSALEIDPFPHTALVDALELSNAHVPAFPTSAPAVIAQIHSPQVAAEVKLTLMSLYPDEHRVKLVHAAGTRQQVVEDLALYEIDRSRQTGLLTALYLPPLGPATSYEAFQEVIAHLRAPDGCPWDREQTHQSLRTYLLEETYEVLAALDSGDVDALREELGDLLLQVVLHAQIADEAGEFNMAEVLEGVNTKIVRRHPHVFGDLELRDAKGVLQNWERLKAEERNAKGKAEHSLLDSIALALPALVQASEYQQRAARVGFDWPSISGVIDKVHEELDEVLTAPDEAARAGELGDLLFAVVNLARWHQVDPESALRETNQRFRRRFSHIEATARQQGRSVSDLSLEEMESLWQSAKRK